MTTEQKKLREAWLTILSILKETGYDYMYEGEILKYQYGLLLQQLNL